MSLARVGLAFILLVAGVAIAACDVACSTALAAGTLTADGETLVLADASGAACRELARQCRCSRDGRRLVLADFFGNVVAREGDYIEMGGGTAPTTSSTAAARSTSATT